MNEFRVALEAFLAGRANIQSLEDALRASLQRQPHLAAAHSAIIEAMFRSQRLPAPTRDSLHKIVQSAGQAAAPALPPAPPAPPAPQPPAVTSDKTQFRMPAAAPTPPPVESSDKTQFRMPRPGPPRAPSPTPPTPPTPRAAPPPAPAPTPRAAPPPPSAPAPPPRAAPPPPVVPPAAAPPQDSHADRTQLRARPLATGEPPAKPPSPGATGGNQTPPPTGTPPQTGAPSPRTPAPSAPPQRTTGSSVPKSGLLSDLLGSSVASESPEPPAGDSTPPVPPASSPDTGSGTGPITGTSSPTGTGPVTGTGPWTGTGSSTGRRTGTGSASGSSWSNLRDADNNAAPLAPGDTIKDRFVLEDIIGKGGMGIVFRARDLRWEEAQDRNPYVAVKVLNEDFKRHPESLKALQRESRKAQNLAHPNVVTVYQFDRDGANVFMVMELLEGEPLDRLIKRHDATGMPQKTALKYTAHMARALAYAHEQGIVHSDFKPANAYMTRDGIVKVFDFGISRAAKRSDKVSGSMTLFDPGTLGALTPAYASCEMIDGLEPDPRDDIYALACVLYELLTGKHPFGKQSAVQARDAKMVPAPVPGLSRSQWRGLTRGLAFSREERSASVMKFLNDVSPQKRSPARWVAIAASVVVVGVAIAIFLPAFLEKRRIQEIAEVFRQGKDQGVPDALVRMAALTPDQRGTLLNDAAARDGLLTYFERQIDAATDESKQKYDFTKAFALIAQADKIFTDSSRVANKKKALEERQNDLTNRLSARFEDALDRGWLIDKQNPENTSRVLAILAQVNANHPLHADNRRLLSKYVEQAGAALDRTNVILAGELIAAGQKLAPQDASLKDLAARVALAASGQKTAERVRTLRASIDTTLGSSPSLEQFDGKRAELKELRAVAPDDSALARWQTQMQSLLDRKLTELSDAHAFADAETLLVRYADLVSESYVAARRDRLADARNEFTELLARLNGALQDAIRAGRLGPPAPNNARSIYQSLDRAGANAEELSAAKDRITDAYLRQARDLRSKGAFDEARAQVAAGLGFGPSPSAAGFLRDEQKEIDDAEQLARSTADARQRQQLAAQRTKEDNDLKAQLAAALKTPKQTIESARSALQLAEKLQNRKVTDPLVQNARRDIQNLMLAEIRSTIEKSGPDAALRFAEQSSALMPESTALSTVLAEIRKASADKLVQKRAAEISGIKANIDALVKAPRLDDKWTRDVNDQLRRLAAYVPDSDPYVVGVKRSMSNAYIAASRKSREGKLLSEADRLLERAAQLMPSHPDLVIERKALADARTQQEKVAQETNLKLNTEALKQRLRDQAKADDTGFLATLRQLKQTLPASDTFLINDAPSIIADSYMRLATKAARRGSYDDAVQMLDRGLENAPKLVALSNMRTLYANLSTLNGQINSASTLSVKDFRAGLDALSRSEAARKDPGLYQAVVGRFQASLESRIRTESGRSPALAASLEEAAQQIFPGQPRTAASRPTPAKGAGSQATSPAASSPAASSPAAAQATAQQPSATGSQSTQGASAPTPTVAAASAALVGAPSPKPCGPKLVAAGKRLAGVCYDMVAGSRGPDVVILPAGGPFPNPVGVMRYEVSNAEYNFYCTSSGRCKTASGDAKLPIVSIGVADGERYAKWLTESSGKVYRLPTDAEWTYIASGVSDRDFNCTIEVNGQKVKGFALVEGKAGTSSSWGVYHIVGNAQEWASTPAGWVARGAAFTDNTSTCTAALGRIHNGAADGKTGFRLVREF